MLRLAGMAAWQLATAAVKGAVPCRLLAGRLLCRATTHNWFVINDGTPQPSVVLGVSGWAPPAAQLLQCV